MLELGYAYLSGLSLPEVAHPHMEELTARLHESTSISVLDGTSVVYVARVAAKRIMTVGIYGRHPVPRARHLDGPGPAGPRTGRLAGRPTSRPPTCSRPPR